MEYSIKSLKFLGYENQIYGNGAGIATLPSAALNDTVRNARPVYTGCNVDIARSIKEEDLSALDYEIPDEYLYQCLKSDDLSSQMNSFSSNEGKGAEVLNVDNACAEFHSSFNVERKCISDKLKFECFSKDPVQDSIFVIQKIVGKRLTKRDTLPTNKRYIEIFSKLDDQGLIRSFRRKYTSAPKQSPFIEIDKLINETDGSSKTSDIVKRRHIKDVFYKSDECMAHTSRSTRILNNQSRSSKKRKPRTKLTANQLFHLNVAFARDHYLTSEKARILSKQLCIPQICLKTWFHNQRAKHKRMNLKKLEQF